MEARINALYEEFREVYPFVSVSRQVVSEFVKSSKTVMKHDVHYLFDYIMANDLAEEVEI